jgi:hypothetical protein
MVIRGAHKFSAIHHDYISKCRAHGTIASVTLERTSTARGSLLTVYLRLPFATAQLPGLQTAAASTACNVFTEGQNARLLREPFPACSASTATRASESLGC